MTCRLKSICRRALGSRGSMLLEYAVVQLGIGLALFVFAEEQFYSPVSGFGPVGREVCGFYKRIQAGVSLPVP